MCAWVFGPLLYLVVHSILDARTADRSLTSTSVIGYRAGVVDRVAIGVFRSAMVAVHERFAKGRQRDAHTEA
jgi:hypothetical protein